MSVLAKSDLPGNLVLVRVKFSLIQSLRVEKGIARSDSKANLMKLPNKVQTCQKLQPKED